MLSFEPFKEGNKRYAVEGSVEEVYVDEWIGV